VTIDRFALRRVLGGFDKEVAAATAAAGAGLNLAYGTGWKWLRPQDYAGWSRARFRTFLGVTSVLGGLTAGTIEPLAVGAVDHLRHKTD
jgi:hypothetical protein